MKQIILAAIGLLCSLAAVAQEDNDDFSNFMQKELEEFDKFIDDANQDFINFLRDPWKEFESKKPIEKRTKPEPVKPTVYDEKKIPKDDKPTQLSIEKILDLSTTESEQKPVIQVKELNKITFDEPTIIIQKKEEPNTVVKKVKSTSTTTETPTKQHTPLHVTTTEETPVKHVDSPSKPIAKEPKLEKKTEEKTSQTTPNTKPTVKQEEKPTSMPTRRGELYESGANRVAVTYGSSTYYLPNALKGQCRLRGVMENDIADAYEIMCSTDYKPLLMDCRQIATELQLNDWGIFMLVRTVAETYCNTESESIVMQQFLLNELGYKAKMARRADNNSMLLLVATDCQIYGRPYMKKEGLTYYVIQGADQPCSFYMCPQDSPKAKNQVKMTLDKSPAFKGATKTTTHSAKGSTAEVTVEVPTALMNFYSTYPQCAFEIYVNSPVNPELSNQLLASLRPQIQGKSETEAANILLNFVQTGFEYATDDEQFGYEKPFFVEELFYYPYCDCEDRSILYFYLIRNLLGLDVVLLDYPNHIATAVRFNEPVKGDHVIVEGHQYTVCDPTYIGAKIGRAQPQYKNVAAKVLKF